MCTINVDHMMYGSWDIKHSRQNFFSFWAIFLPFYPTNNPENQNFQQQKNSLRHYHFTHEWPKSKSYDVWFLRYGVQQTEFFVILGIFLPFYHSPHPLNNPKNQNFEKLKEKNPLEISSFYTCTINENHKIYGSWDINCNRQIFFCHLESFFALLPPNSPKNEHIKKWKKKKKIKCLEISFYTRVPKVMIIGYTVPEIWHVTDVIVIFQFGLFFAFSHF